MHVFPTYRVLASALAAALLWAPGLAAQAPGPGAPGDTAYGPRTFAVLASDAPVRVDGVLDEAVWQSAAQVDVPWEYFPADNAPAPVRTACRVTYDQDALYLGCTAHDPDPSAIRANLTDRDAALDDDHLVFIVDPFNDQRRAFQFRVNPFGVQMDATYSELDKKEDYSWDAIWASAGRLTDEGYVVEAAIPFRSLRFPATQGVQTWGLIAGRVYPRNVVHRLRSHPTDRNQSCLLCQADKLTGLRGIRPGRDVEVTPTLTTRRSDLRSAFPDGSMVDGDVEPEFGLSGRWGITPNVALNATVNPDFSQVEADVAQLQVNERFALLYPEKRPFFLEGADYFATPSSIVYTRSVIEPTGGIKLTGKEGGNVFGVFATRDRFTSLLFPRNAGTGQLVLDDDVTTAVGRFRRDVGRNGTLGALYAGRMGDNGYGNHVGGVDGFLQLGRSNYLRFQVSHSETEYADTVVALGQQAGGFGGDNVYAQLIHASRNWNLTGTWSSVSPGFRADAGFVTRADFRGLQLTAERVFWGRPGQWFRRLGVYGYADRYEDFDGRETDRGLAAVLIYHGPRQSFANVGLGHNRRLFGGKRYNLVDVRPTVQLTPTQRATFTIQGRVGEEIDFTNNREANILQVQPGVDLRLGRRLNVGLDHTLRRLTTQGDDPAGGGEEILSANLTQARVIYHFNVRTFVRAIVQYQDVDFAPDLFAVPVPGEQRTLFSQLMFAYKLNPQTVVFAGYTDDRLGLDTVDLTPTGRTFFLKLGYNWQP